MRRKRKTANDLHEEIRRLEAQFEDDIIIEDDFEDDDYLRDGTGPHGRGMGPGQGLGCGEYIADDDDFEEDAEDDAEDDAEAIFSMYADEDDDEDDEDDDDNDDDEDDDDDEDEIEVEEGKKSSDNEILDEIRHLESRLNASEVSPGIEDTIHDPFAEMQEGAFKQYDYSGGTDTESDIIKTKAPIEDETVISPSLNARKARLNEAMVRLDKLATYLEKNGKVKTAFVLDKISDKIETELNK